VRVLRLVAICGVTIMLWAGHWGALYVEAQSASKQKWCLSFHEVHPSLTVPEAKQKGVPAGYRIYSWTEGVRGEKDLLLREEPVLHGGDMADAQPSFDPRTNLPIITFRFNAAGTHKFAMFTRNNVFRQFAIVVDGGVITAPVIREPILGGKGQISGNFTSESAAQLAARIRSGTCAEVSRLPGPALSWPG
jgi:preprotein translocase subunit SecD